MSTFYVLPERNTVTTRLSASMAGLAPVGSELADRFAELVEQPPHVFVVFADDLPNDPQAELPTVLSELFGAEADDEVIDLRAA